MFTVLIPVPDSLVFYCYCVHPQQGKHVGGGCGDAVWAGGGQDQARLDAGEFEDQGKDERLCSREGKAAPGLTKGNKSAAPRSL